MGLFFSPFLFLSSFTFTHTVFFLFTRKKIKNYKNLQIEENNFYTNKHLKF